MKKYKAVIFDLDGTLVDAYGAISKSFNFTMKTLGYPPQSSHIVRRAVGWGDKKLLEPFVRKEDVQAALSIYRRHHARALKAKAGSRLLPYAGGVLKFLKAKGYALAIASNRPTRFSWIIIRHLALKRFFSAVLCADMLRHSKPHPAILKAIMKRLGVTCDETLYVGDMTIDAKTGNAAGVKTVIVTTGSSSRTQIQQERPYRIIGSLRELLGIV